MIDLLDKIKISGEEKVSGDLDIPGLELDDAKDKAGNKD